MENRSVRHEDRNESSGIRATEVSSRTRARNDNSSSLDREELRLLVEFFQLLDRWDRQEVVQ
jgi:hypothetical protein